MRCNIAAIFDHLPPYYFFSAELFLMLLFSCPDNHLAYGVWRTELRSQRRGFESPGQTNVCEWPFDKHEIAIRCVYVRRYIVKINGYYNSLAGCKRTL